MRAIPEQPFPPVTGHQSLELYENQKVFQILMVCRNPTVYSVSLVCPVLPAYLALLVFYLHEVLQSLYYLLQLQRLLPLSVPNRMESYPGSGLYGNRLRHFLP